MPQRTHGKRMLQFGKRARRRTYPPKLSGHLPVKGIDEAITAWLKKVRGANTQVRVESIPNLMGQTNFLDVYYKNEDVTGRITLCKTFDGEQYFQHTGGGRYGPQSTYNIERLKE